MNGFPHFRRLNSIKLSYHQPLIAHISQAVVEYPNHFVSGSFLDVPKPVINIEMHHLLHHRLVGYSSRVTVGIGITTIIVVLSPMAGVICNVD